MPYRYYEATVLYRCFDITAVCFLSCLIFDAARLTIALQDCAHGGWTPKGCLIPGHTGTSMDPQICTSLGGKWVPKVTSKADCTAKGLEVCNR